MKYIRTKDGIYELMPNIEQDYEVSFDNKTLEPAYYTIDTDWIAKKDVLAQADTIDELTDEAVFFDKDNKPHYKSQEGNIWYLGAGLFTETLRFGIFTDKGLIYVAKMNDKGELELL